MSSHLHDGAMNIHPFRTASAFAPAEWTLEFVVQKVGSTVQSSCVISHEGEPMCRLSVMNEDGDCDEVRLVLAEKARAWIAAFLERGSRASA